MPWMALVNSVRDSAGIAYICGSGEGCEVGEIRAPDVAGTRAPDVAGTPDVGGFEVGGIGGGTAPDVDMISDTRLLRRLALLRRKYGGEAGASRRGGLRRAGAVILVAVAKG
jgi:hypothetical protein